MNKDPPAHTQVAPSPHTHANASESGLAPPTVACYPLPLCGPRSGWVGGRALTWPWPCLPAQFLEEPSNVCGENHPAGRRDDWRDCNRVVKETHKAYADYLQARRRPLSVYLEGARG